jgi:cysteinylglycine-S-conjugate dipeptidase
MTQHLPAILAHVDAQAEAARGRLCDWLRIPSISAQPAHAADCGRAAEWVRDQLTGMGFAAALRPTAGHPVVVAHHPGPGTPGTPHLLFYGHYDVQPADPLPLWTSPPFEPVIVEGPHGPRVVARGAVDDKGQTAMWLEALRAWHAVAGGPPCRVTVLVEGEEEVGSPNLERFLAEHRERLRADVIVIADSANWDIGAPALTTTLRGLVDCFVEVRTLDHAVHSGLWGGAVPDALTSLCRLLATLHDERGDVAVEGLLSGPADDVDYPVDRLRAESGIADGVELIGTGSVVERLWTKPAVAVIGFDATATKDASNTLIPMARAKVSVRVAPGDTPQNAMACLKRHLEEHAPWGARVTVHEGEQGAPTRIDATGPAYDAARAAFEEAWGVAPVDMGMGGSIPFIAELQEAFPEASVLVTGVEDPDTRAHGANEGLHLAEFARVCLAEALLLRNLGA